MGEHQSALGWANDSPQGQSHGHLVGIGVHSAVFMGEGSEEKDLHEPRSVSFCYKTQIQETEGKRESAFGQSPRTLETDPA